MPPRKPVHTFWRNPSYAIIEFDPDTLLFEALDGEHEALGIIASTHRHENVGLAEELHQ